MEEFATVCPPQSWREIDANGTAGTPTAAIGLRPPSQSTNTQPES